MYLRWKDWSKCIKDGRMGVYVSKMEGWECMYLRQKDQREFIQDVRVGVYVSKMEGLE